MLNHAYPKKVTLRDGRSVTVRPLADGDFDKLFGFFQTLPEEDRLFLRHDVTDPQIVGAWVANLDFNRVIPLVAEDEDKIVADATLHLATHGWSQHAGQVRLVTARTHRRVGLGTVLTRELVGLAEERGLEKLQTHVIEDDVGSVKMFSRLGFVTAAVLKEWVKDRGGTKRNLAIMTNNVPDLTRIMEEWILQTMQAAFRVPDDGVA
ncbi:MAG: GNAT family N-acetyltransferase [Phycisphaerae bacterium]